MMGIRLLADGINGIAPGAAGGGGALEIKIHGGGAGAAAQGGGDNGIVTAGDGDGGPGGEGKGKLLHNVGGNIAPVLPALGDVPLGRGLAPAFPDAAGPFPIPPDAADPLVGDKICHGLSADPQAGGGEGPGDGHAGFSAGPGAFPGMEQNGTVRGEHQVLGGGQGGAVALAGVAGGQKLHHGLPRRRVEGEGGKGPGVRVGAAEGDGFSIDFRGVEPLAV